MLAQRLLPGLRLLAGLAGEGRRQVDVIGGNELLAALDAAGVIVPKELGAALDEVVAVLLHLRGLPPDQRLVFALEARGQGADVRTPGLHPVIVRVVVFRNQIGFERRAVAAAEGAGGAGPAAPLRGCAHPGAPGRRPPAETACP